MVNALDAGAGVVESMRVVATEEGDFTVVPDCAVVAATFVVRVLGEIVVAGRVVLLFGV